MKFRWWWWVIIVSVLVVWYRSAPAFHAFNPEVPSSELHVVGAVFNSLMMVGFLAVPLILSGLEWEDTGSILSFVPIVSAVLFVGGWALWDYFTAQGYFLLWPIAIVSVIAVLFFLRARYHDKLAAKRAEKAKELFPPPYTRPNNRGSSTKGDFSDWR